MKNNIFNYFKKLVKVLSWPIVFMVGQFFISYIFSFVYSLFHSELPLEVLTLKINDFLENSKVLVTFVGFVIFVPLFIKDYKKLREDKYLFNVDYFYIFLFSIGYSIIINILFLNINNIFGINSSQFLTVPKGEIIALILCTGIMGPIIEEFLFRGIIFNKFKKFNSERISILLTSILFSLLHMNFFNIINTFILSYILIFIYNKYKTLLAPIILHIGVNTTVVLIINIIVINVNNLNSLLFLMGIIFVLISSVKIFKNT